MPITKGTPLEDIIRDFVHSNDKRFAGKSKEERIKMAQGAFYSMHEQTASIASDWGKTLKTHGFRNITKDPSGVDIFHSDVLGDIHVSKDGSWSHFSVRGGKLHGTGNNSDEFKTHVKGLQMDMFNKKDESVLSTIISGDKDILKDVVAKTLCDKILVKIEEKKQQFAEEMFGENTKTSE